MSWPPRRRPGEDAFAYRFRYEVEACQRECGVSGCTNRATHTWSGHPTCDEHALPGRKPTVLGEAALQVARAEEGS